MSSSSRHRKDVMHLCHRRQPAFFQTSLAERMLLHIAVPYLPPTAAVFLFYLRRSRVLLVILCHQLPMLFAVSPIAQLRAAGICTGLLGSPRHGSHFLAIEKPCRFCPARLSLSTSHAISIPQISQNVVHDFTHLVLPDFSRKGLSQTFTILLYHE